MKVSFVFLCALLGLSVAASLPGGRILGGHVAGLGQFPYMASLRSAANMHFCGAFIHNSRWLLTAAHCVVGRTNANTVSVVGTLDRTNGGVTHLTQNIINHPNYNANNLANDISLIWTVNSIIFSELVSGVPLNTAAVGAGVIGVASGWGMTALPGYSPDTLHWLPAQTISTTTCRLAHTVSDRSRISDAQICTENTSGSGMCIGDNGGPLVAGNSVLGLHSWSIPCGTGVPDVYTRISHHIAWLNNNITYE